MTKKALTDKGLKALYNTPSTGDGHRVCKLDAGGTLHLFVREGVNGLTRAWQVRFQENGKRIKRGLGTWEELGSIKAAKEYAEKYVRTLRDTGEDIRKASAETGARRETFGLLFPEWIEAVRIQKNGKGESPERITYRMSKHVMPRIENLAPSELTPQIAASIINGVKGKASAVKVTAHLRKFCQWLQSEGKFPPGLLPLHPDLIRPYLKERLDDHKPRAFLDPVEVPRFVATLTAPDSVRNVSSLALLFSILNCLRQGDVNGVHDANVPALHWGQIEQTENGVILTIPSAYLKVKTHPDLRIALSRQSVALLEFVKTLGLSNPSDPDAIIFPNGRGHGLSNMAFGKRIKDLHARDLQNGGKGFFDRDPKKDENGEVLKDANGAPVYAVATQHGIARASFKTWQQENHPELEQAAELCLDHHGDKYKGAYSRSPFFEPRKQLLQAWADFCFSDCPERFAG